MDYLRSVFSKKQNIFLISAGISLIIFGILTLICVKISGNLMDQQASKRWCDDQSYVQVSAFLSELSGFEESSMRNVRGFLENRLDTDSILAKNDNARRVILSYCSEGEAELSSGKNTLTVKAYGVGGDFFLFHPFKLLYGSYFDGDDIMQDHVVIDSTAAWNLFGSSNVVGQIIKVGGREHIISAVVERESGRLNDLAGNNVATVYMSMESLKEFGTFTYLSTIEAILPNPITNYAANILEEAVDLDESRISIVQNTARFNWKNLVSNAKNFGVRGMNSKGLVYPYWENVARGTEDVLTPVCVLAIIFLLYTLGVLAVLLFRMWKKRTIHKKDVFDFILHLIELYRENKKRRIEDGEYI